MLWHGTVRIHPDWGRTMLKQDIIDAVMDAAAAAKLPPAALLAVVEVESAGVALEEDGRTPRLLFERHVFWRELDERRRPIAEKAGLAHQLWKKATQYKDQSTSRARLALLARARQIGEEEANRSCSWGLGQTMGFLAEELGFASATAMLRHMMDGGVRTQVDMMVREILKKGIGDELQRGDWAGFARVYNGPRYAENKYDSRMAAAARRWQRMLDAGGGKVEAPASSRLSKYEVEAIQNRLVELGYPEVGKVDGRWGEATAGAVNAFRRYEGLPPGDYDDALRQALAIAQPRNRAVERETATAEDLRAAGSETIRSADLGRQGATALIALGGGGAAKQSGALDHVQGVLDQVQVLQPVIDGAREVLIWIGDAWWIGALVGGFFIWRSYGNIITRRVADYASGRHA